MSEIFYANLDYEYIHNYMRNKHWNWTDTPTKKVFLPSIIELKQKTHALYEESLIINPVLGPWKYILSGGIRITNELKFSFDFDSFLKFKKESITNSSSKIEKVTYHLKTLVMGAEIIQLGLISGEEKFKAFETEKHELN